MCDSQRPLKTTVVTLIFITAALRVAAFSLLGPFEPWMDRTNNLRVPGDIGGPMKIDEEHRWNTPVITYGFDQSFVNYFGSNGIAAVENAFAVLNNLPPASQTIPAITPPK